MNINQLARIIAASSLMTALGTVGDVNATPNSLLAQETEETTYNEFQSFLRKAVGNPDYRVSYEINTPNQPTGTVQQWFKGEKFRIDTQMQGNKARIYRRENGTTTCINQGGSWSCFQMPDMGRRSSPSTHGLERLKDVEENLETYENRITKTGNRVVAGEETTCFRIEEQQQAESWLSCYANNYGIPLYMEGTTDEGAWQMTATDFQPSVSEADFNLPAKPQTMPNMPSSF